MELKRVVVTGIGAITPLGNNTNDYWNGLVNGVSGADFITLFDASKFKTRFACEVKDFDPLKYVAKKEARKMGAFTQYAIAASDEALADSGLKITDENAEDIGVYISSGIGDFWGIERRRSPGFFGRPGFSDRSLPGKRNGSKHTRVPIRQWDL